MTNHTDEIVTFTEDHKIGWIQINRPNALNAINMDVLKKLNHIVTHLAKCQHLSVVIIKSSGDKAFVAGADIKEMEGLSQTQAREFSNYGSQVFEAIEKLPQITFAQVQGFALGGGLELALATDIIVASENAKFGLPEVSLGLIPGFGGTQRLALRIGIAKAIEWTCCGDRYSALEAHKLGLLNHVIAPERLEEFTVSLAQKICKNGPAAVKRSKNAIRYKINGELINGLKLESDYFAACFQTPESTEGLKAFIEKRPPIFSQ